MELQGKDLEKYKKILFDTMKAFIAFCEENGLMYYACGGTALGAIRHKGIIPWDDDIDVLMPRKDYNRLKELSGKLAGSGYELLNYDNCKGYTATFMKFCDANTTIWEVNYSPCIIGVYIDIFPLDEAADEESAHEIFDVYNSYFRAAYEHRVREFVYYVKKFRIGDLIQKIWRIIFHKHYKNRFSELDQKASDARGDHAIFYGGFYKFKREYGLKSWYGQGTMVDFEDFKVRVPQDYDAYLSNLYGDYMTPPPPGKRCPHHSRYYVNLDKRMTIREVRALRIKAEKIEKYIYE